MKPRSFRLSILFLALASVLSLLLASCGASSDADTLVGTWETTVDETDVINNELVPIIAQMEGDEGFDEYIKIDSFTYTMQFIFKSDDTYEIKVVGVKEAYESIKTAMTAGATRFLDEYIAQIGAENGLSEEEVYASIESSRDALLAQVLTSINTILSDDVANASIEQVETSGRYKAKDGKLHLSDSKDHLVDENCYYKYELSGNTLTLRELIGGDGTESLELPQTLTKK